MDYESLYSTATAALDSQLEITVKLQEQIIRLEDENNRFREEDGWKDIVHCQTNKIILLEKRIKELEAEKVADVRCSIDSEGNYTKYTYCYVCGTGVRNQKYCSQCGRKLNWQALKG